MEADLARLNCEIEQLQSSLQTLISKRDELQAKLSPLRNCPTEILQHIFSWTLEPFSTLSIDEGPLLLGRVCNRWRDITLSTPQFWNSLHIAVPEALYSHQNYAAKCNRIRLGVATWLSRAKVIPLYISVFSRNENIYQEDVSQVAEILQLLMPFSRQWKYLNLQVPASSLSVLNSLEGTDVPLLESAMIACSDTNPFALESTSSRHPSFLETAPALLRLTLGDAGPSFHPYAPWSQLHFLSLDHSDWNFSAPDVLRLLTNCSSLRECVLTIHARTDLSRSSDSDEEPVVSLPYLSKFSLNTNATIMSQMFDRLFLPNMRHLHLDGYRAEISPPVIASLKGLLHRSQHPLESLKLETKRPAGLASSAFIDLLRSMPKLRLLVFAEGSTQMPIVDEEILDALARTNEDVICPMLEAIHLSDRYTFSEQALERFIANRINPDSSRSPTTSSTSSSSPTTSEAAQVVEPSEKIIPLQFVSIVTFRPGLGNRFSARFVLDDSEEGDSLEYGNQSSYRSIPGPAIKIIQDVPFRSLPTQGRPRSRYIDYPEEFMYV